MRIGFFNNQIDNRGTGNAVFDYADYNEKILGNESVILTYKNGAHDKLAIQRYLDRFNAIYEHPYPELRLDALYHIKSGKNDGAFKSFSPYLVHSVFDNQPHGNIYATVSSWLGTQYNLPYVPHIVSLPEHMDSLRTDIGIPESAIVFGRHGGADTFDIPWAWDAIKRVTDERDDVWFLLMNTNVPDLELNQHVVFVNPTANPYHKRAFINACDAMIHARLRGETFGIAVGEFAICGKPVISYLDSPEKAHLKELGPHGLYYHDERMLYLVLDSFVPQTRQPLYTQYTPEKVMAKFKEVFLDGLN